MDMKKPAHWVIGIDEAGRGPLAGPVAVGVVLVPANFDWRRVPGVGDSKQLSEAKREEIYQIANNLHKCGQLQYAVSMVSAKVIDTVGIVPAVNLALTRALARVIQSTNSPVEPWLQELLPRSNWGRTNEADWGRVAVKLDGGLKAPAYCVEQETIIKGDGKEKVIGLASIMAKVTRDRYMRRIASRPAYAAYDFTRHKGYGTKIHRAAIAKYGLSLEHRASYCRNIKLR